MRAQAFVSPAKGDSLVKAVRSDEGELPGTPSASAVLSPSARPAATPTGLGLTSMPPPTPITMAVPSGKTPAPTPMQGVPAAPKREALSAITGAAQASAPPSPPPPPSFAAGPLVRARLWGRAPTVGLVHMQALQNELSAGALADSLPMGSPLGAADADGAPALAVPRLLRGPPGQRAAPGAGPPNLACWLLCPAPGKQSLPWSTGAR
jgi:hypothetical protein